MIKYYNFGHYKIPVEMENGIPKKGTYSISTETDIISISFCKKCCDEEYGENNIGISKSIVSKAGLSAYSQEVAKMLSSLKD